MPHVASKASVLQSQHSGLTQRDRMPEAKTDNSPFSILLADTGSAPAPTRYQSWRAQNSTSSQRSDASRTDAQRPQRPDEGNGAADPTADAAATGQTEGAAEPIEVAATAEAPQTGETASKPAAEAKPATDEPATDEARHARCRVGRGGRDAGSAAAPANGGRRSHLACRGPGSRCRRSAGRDRRGDAGHGRDRTGCAGAPSARSSPRRRKRRRPRKRPKSPINKPPINSRRSASRRSACARRFRPCRSQNRRSRRP